MIRNILLWLLSCGPALCWAQPSSAPDTLLIELPEVTIPADRIPASLGTQRFTISFPDQSLTTASSLAQLLQEQSSIYIKSYGIGQLATPASRGASANHTQIAWNGVAINSPSLGQTDLSLIPAQSTAQLWLRPNPSSTQWGNGAIGGVIELENQPPPDGWRASLSNQAGSFGQWNQHLGVENTLSVWSQQTRIGRWTADNDFPYRSLSGDENRMPNASVNSHYLTHDQFLQLKHHTISGHLWLQEAKRDIPPLRGQLNNDAFQEDRILRSMFQWKWTKGKWNSHTQVAFLKERIYYEQASAQLVSDASTESWVARWEGAYTPKSSSPIQLGAQFRRDQYAPSFQNESLRQRQLALWIQANQYIKENWKFTGGLRMALLDTLPAEFLPSLRIRYQDNQDWQFQWSLNRVFRMPTMNDRFWVPGGNPALSPETGWTTQAGISKSWKKGNAEHQFALDHFQLWIQNWIIWLPEINFWSPQNVAEVWSRGMESRYRFGYQKTRWSGHIDISYQWTQTTNQRTKQPNDRSLGKQLIYVPQHQGRLNASFQYGQWKLQWNQQWTGRVFTLADNSREIPGFFLSDLRLGRRFSFAPFSLDINGSIQNLWDKDYEVVVARPMPGRHFLLDVRFFFNYK